MMVTCYMRHDEWYSEACTSRTSASVGSRHSHVSRAVLTAYEQRKKKNERKRKGDKYSKTTGGKRTVMALRPMCDRPFV